MRLPFEDKAAEELEAVAQFYERERPGYGRLFLASSSSPWLLEDPSRVARVLLCEGVNID